MHYDKFLNDLNGFGRFQKLRFALICVSALLPPLSTYLHSFIAANPNHRCKNPFDSEDDFSIKTTSFNTTDYSLSIGKCEYKINGTRIKCSSWVFDKTYYRTTLTEEWSMVCDRSMLRSNVQTIYFSGVLFGSLFFGLLSDRFGRKPIILLSFVFFIISGFGIAFGPQEYLGILGSYAIYAVFRFIVAIATRGINNTAFILGVELVGSEKKTFAGMIFQYFFPIGQLFLVLAAYLIRDWRTLSWVITIPSVPFLLYFFVLPESPRWLIVKNRQNTAYKLFKQIAHTNNRILSDDKWNEFLNKENEENQKSNTNAINENILTVFKSFKFSILSLTLYLHWIVNNFIFYGVGLKSNDLGANPYMTFAISATVEVVSIMATHQILERFGRKVPYGISLFIAGTACLAIVFIDNTVAVVSVAMIGKFFVSSSYSAIYVYSSEMFPTSVRNSLLGSCSMMARVGAMIAPLINGLGESGWEKLPFLVFGISGIVIGMTTFILPETKGLTLPKSIKEAEKTMNIKLNCHKKKPIKRITPTAEPDEYGNTRV